MSIEVRQLSKVYGEQNAVDNISFTARKGEILGFLGPNGAGKTTTMKMICGYLPPTHGTINVCGLDVIANPRDAKRMLGYLPEHNPLYKDMFVREYLRFFADLLKLKNAASRVDELIEMTGLTKEQNKLIGSLSKGYRQRVGLSQALIQDPEVLVLDEPTSGLDPNQLVEIRQLIKSIGSQKTLVFSTHIMQEVQALCDRVLIINKGKLIADDTIQSLMKQVSNKRIISVEFSNAIQIKDLQNIQFVEEVKALGGGKYHLISAPDKDIREGLFKLSSQNSWTIKELKEEKSSVEEVFNVLTKNAD
ncbi:MAG: gliding motility-associated ABC transporter ATP-binding subunit GldA [Saprospiraceae bacterium]|nr:gliding motility-associated ABC transporter ATP-binding subunit GldA [Saprospiraceae bacterium]